MKSKQRFMKFAFRLMFLMLGGMLLFSSCENIFSGDDLKTIISNEVETATAPEVTVTVQRDPLVAGGTISGDKTRTVKVGVEFTISVDVSNLYGFTGWTDVGETGAVSFADAASATTTATVTKEATGIIIQANFNKRPTLEMYSPVTVTGTYAVTNSKITLTFNEAMSPDTIDLANVSIGSRLNGSSAAFSSINDRFNEPIASEGNIVYTIALKSGSSFDQNSNVRVAVSSNVADAAGLTMSDDIAWVFTVGTSADDTAPYFASSGDLTILMADGSAFTNTVKATTGQSIIIKEVAADDSGDLPYMKIVETDSASGQTTSTTVTYQNPVTYSFMTSGEGKKTLSATVIDASDNESAAKTVDVYYDITAPSVSSLLLDGGASYADNQTVPVSFSASDGGNGSGIAQWQISESATVGSAWLDSAPSSYTFSDSVDGGKTVYIYVKDAAGNLAVASAHASITLDTLDPVMTLTSNDGDGLVCGSQTVRFTATFVEANGISTSTPPTIKIGSGAAVQMAPASNLIWTYDWIVPASSATPYDNIGIPLVVSALDNAGNSCVTGSGTLAYVTVDNIAPTVAIGAPSVSSVNSAGTVSYAITYADSSGQFSTSSPYTLTAVTRNVTGTATTGTVAISGGTSSTPTVVISGLGGDGSMTLTVPAGAVTDKAGNTNLATTSGVVVTVDNTAPTVASFAIGSSEYTNSLSNTLSIGTQNGTGTAIIEYALTTSVTAPASGWSGSAPSSVTLTDFDGTQHWYLHVKDAAGNTGYATDSITLDRVAPDVELSGMESGSSTDQYVRSAVHVIITATFNEAVNQPKITISGSGVTAVSAANMTQGPGNTKWTYEWTPVGNGIATVNVNTTDLAGNGNAVEIGVTSYTVDNTKPTVSISADKSAVNSGGTVTYTITYGDNSGSFASSSPYNLTSVVQTVSGTAVADSTPTITNGATSSATVALNGLTGEGTLTLRIPAGVVTDAAGNTNDATDASSALSVDNTKPTVSISADKSAVNSGGTVTYTITYGDNSGSFASSSPYNLTSVVQTVSGTAVADSTPTITNGATSSATVALNGLTGEGTLTLRIPAGAVTDAAGNANDATDASSALSVDNTKPTVSISADKSAVNSSGTVTYTITYGDNSGSFASSSPYNLTSVVQTVSGTAVADSTPTITNGATSSATVALNGLAGTGTLTLRIPAGAVTDAAGNTNDATDASSALSVDNTKPTVSISADKSAVNSSGTVTYTITYGDNSGSFASSSPYNLTSVVQSVSGTAVADSTPTITNGATSSATVALNGLAGTGTLTLRIPAGVVTDAVGNTNDATDASSALSVDNTKPTVSISADKSAVNSSGTVTYTITYGDNSGSFASSSPYNLTSVVQTVSGTAVADSTPTITNGATSSATVALDGLTGEGTLTLRIPAGVVTDAVGNTNDATDASSALSVDNTKPTVSISADKSAVNSSGTVTYTITYGDNSGSFASSSPYNLTSVVQTVSGTAVADSTPTITNGATSSATVALNGLTGEGTLTLRIPAGVVTDAAGNTNDATDASSALSVDNTKPTVSISADKSAVNSGGTVTYTITYGDNSGSFASSSPYNLTSVVQTVSGTAVADSTPTITNGATSSATVALNGLTGTGTLTLQIPAGVVTDAAGNTNDATDASSALSVDNTKPTVSISADKSAVNSSGTVTYTITYGDNSGSFASSSPYNLTSVVQTVSGTAVADSTPTITNGATSSATVALDGLTGTGTLTLQIPAGVVTDAVGNTNDATDASSALSVDNTKPTVSISADKSAVNSSGTVTYTITYGDNSGSFASSSPYNLTSVVQTVSGTAVADSTPTITNGATSSATVALNGLTGEGTLTLRIPAGVVTDAAGNTNDATDASSALSVDNTKPTVSISADKSAVNSSGTVTYTITYGDNSGSFASSSPYNLTSVVQTVSGTAVADSTPTITNGATSSATVALNGLTGTGTLTLRIPAGVVTDAAGNTNDATDASSALSVDNTKPTVSISADKSAVNSSGTVTYTITYGDNSGSFASSSPYNLTSVVQTVSGTAVADSTPTITNGATSSATVALDGLTGTGTLTLRIPAGVVTDAVGNTNDATDASSALSVDNTKPTVSISADKSAVNSSGTVTYTITYGDNSGSFASSSPYNLTSVVQTVSGTAVADSTPTITNGATSSATVALDGLTGTGTLTLRIPAGVVTDAVGNTNDATDASSALSVDNTKPTVSISADKSAVNSSGTVTYAITYGDNSGSFASSSPYNLTSVVQTVSGTAVADSTPTITNGATSSATVALNGLTGEGTLTLRIPAGVVTDAVGNTNDATDASSALSVDNTPPSIFITGNVPTATDISGVPTLTIKTNSADLSGLKYINYWTGAIAKASATDVSQVIIGTPITGDNQTISRELSSIITAGTFRFSLADAAGNETSVSYQMNWTTAYVYDTTYTLSLRSRPTATSTTSSSVTSYASSTRSAASIARARAAVAEYASSASAAVSRASFEASALPVRFSASSVLKSERSNPNPTAPAAHSSSKGRAPEAVTQSAKQSLEPQALPKLAAQSAAQSSEAERPDENPSETEKLEAADGAYSLEAELALSVARSAVPPASAAAEPSVAAPRPAPETPLRAPTPSAPARPNDNGGTIPAVLPASNSTLAAAKRKAESGAKEEEA